MKKIRVGNGAGFWGDNLDAPVDLVKKGKLDYLTLEYLAELTLSILAHIQRKTPQFGYITDFPPLVEHLASYLKQNPSFRIITNAGGLNPLACAKATALLLKKEGLYDIPIAIVTGDNLKSRLPSLIKKGETFPHHDTQKTEARFAEKAIQANAYLGAKGIVDALRKNARIVITGRVADASLTVAPSVFEFGWHKNDYNKYAGAAVAGHLIECGAQVTGGLLTRWKTCPGYEKIGYPIAEVYEDGSCVITKPSKTGGVVNFETVTEQLVYEIGDPKCYITPDVVVDFTSLKVEDNGNNRVLIKGAKGSPPPSTYKVASSFYNGYMGTAELVIVGEDAKEKAEKCSAIILERLKKGGYRYEKVKADYLGDGGASSVVFKMTVKDSQKEAIERFFREFSPLVTSGPPGITGYAGAKPHVRPVFQFWPTQVARDHIPISVEVKTVKEW